MRLLLPLLLAASSSATATSLHESLLSPFPHDVLLKRQAGTPPKCTNGFSLSADKLSCVCRAPKVTNVGKTKCLTACTSGSFAVGDGTCAACPATFAKCSSAGVATGCVDGYFLLGKTCVAVCPSNQWGDATPGKNRCRACVDKDAATCSNSGTTSTACMTKYLYKGACIDTTKVPDGFFPDAATHTVKPCASGVRTCTSDAVGGATACGKTSKGDQLFLTPKRTCDLHCPSRFYGNKLLGACLPCDSTALTCDALGAKTCAKDSAGKQLFLTPTRNCILQEAGPAGYFADRPTSTFLPCDDGVTSCSGKGAGKALSCGKRTDGTPLFWTEPRLVVLRNLEEKSTRTQRLSRRQAGVSVEGDCVEADDCPSRTWADPVMSVCQPCDDNEEECSKNGAGGSLVCKRDFYLSASHDCLTAEQCKASGAFFPDLDIGACSNCDPGELVCTANGVGFATACGTNDGGEQLYLYNGDCVAALDCPAAFFPDDASKSCVACSAGALQCTGLTEATLCGATDEGARLFLSEGMCVEACEEDSWANPGTGNCELCTTIDPDAETCDSPTSFTCATKFFLPSASRCVSACPPAHFADVAAQICSPCADEDAAACASPWPGTATACKTRNLDDGHCVESCSSGKFAYDFDRLCRSCDYFSTLTATCSQNGPLTCWDEAVIGYDNERWMEVCVPAASCADGYNIPDNGRCVSCMLKYQSTITCDASGPTSCFYTHALYKRQCVLKCAQANYRYNYEPASEPPTVWQRAQYRTEAGECGRDCLDLYAFKCDQTTGRTTDCIKAPSWCTNW
ncbi:hypothetical protein JCM6882_008852 [Rhodosporidiobolus microsporus]